MSANLDDLAGPLGLTLVAFYGEKPERLAELIGWCQAQVSARVGSGFVPYDIEQVHATIVGLEGRSLDGRLVNEGFLRRGEDRSMDLPGVLRFLHDTPLLPFRVRIGGFRTDETYGFESLGRHPFERSFEIQQSRAVVAMGWPVSGRSFTHAVYELRRELERFGVLHKYHVSRADRDNDLFFVLGTVDETDARELERGAVSDSIRCELAQRKPIFIEVDRRSLSLVRYEDRRLPPLSSVRLPLDRGGTPLELSTLLG